MGTFAADFFVVLICVEDVKVRDGGFRIHLCDLDEAAFTHSQLHVFPL